MKLIIFLFFLFEMVIVTPIRNKEVENFELNKDQDMEYEFPSDLFLSDDNSDIFLSVTPNKWIMAIPIKPSSAGIYPTDFIEDMFVLNDRLYTISSTCGKGGLKIYDIKDHSSIFPIGHDNNDNIYEMNNIFYVDDGFLFLLDQSICGSGMSKADYEVRIYNVENPIGPFELSGSLFAGGTSSPDIFGITVKSNLLFVSQYHYFTIMDVSNKSNIVSIWESSFYGDCRFFKSLVHEDVVFVTTNKRGLIVFNITDINHSYEIGSYLDNQYSDISIFGDLLYAVESVFPNYFLKVLNISDPSNPKHVGISVSLEIESFSDLFVSENYVYILGDTYWIILNTTSKTGLGEPKILKSFFEADKPLRIHVKDEEYCFVGKQSGIDVYNVSNPFEPIAYMKPNHEFISSKTIRRVGDLFFFLNKNEGYINYLYVFDITNHDNPTFLGYLNPAFLEVFSTAIFNDFYLLDELVFLIGSDNERTWLKILNYTLEERESSGVGYSRIRFEVIATLTDFVHSAKEVKVRKRENDYIVFMHSNTGFSSLSLILPNSTAGIDLVWRSLSKVQDFNIDTFDVLYQEKERGKIFILDGKVNGRKYDIDLKIYEFDEEGIIINILSSTRFDIEDAKSFSSIYVDEKYVYVACGDEGVYILDHEKILNNVSIDDDETVIRNVVTNNAINVFSQGEYLYIADTNALRIIELSDSSNLAIVNSFYFEKNDVSGVYVDNNFVIVANGFYGIEVVEFGISLKGSNTDFSYFCGETTIEINAVDSSGSDKIEFILSRPSYCENDGKCISKRSCACKNGFAGEFCSTWYCDEIDFKLFSKTCNGHGNCLSPERCSCDFGFDGEFCNRNILLLATVPGSSVIASSIVTVWAGSILLFLISICITCLCCVCVCSCWLCFVLLKLFPRIKKYEKLRDFDLLLKEQFLEDDESRNMAHLKINKKLFEIPYSEIKIDRMINKGGSDALVFKAFWRGGVVAFKCFKTKLLCETQLKFDQFEAEVNLLANIHHPNIIRFFGASLHPPRVGILMEFCDNGEILQFFIKYREENIMNMEKYAIVKKLRMCREIIGAMEYLHSRNIVHRDIKSENILIDFSETPKIMDFGISKIIESSTATRRIGTSLYMAPEVLRGQYDNKCDSFSFSILLWILFTEEEEVYGPSVQDVEFRVANDPSFRPNLETLNESLYGIENGVVEEGKYDWLVRVICKGWNEDPTVRFSFEELSKIFEEEKKC